MTTKVTIEATSHNVMALLIQHPHAVVVEQHMIKAGGDPFTIHIHSGRILTLFENAPEAEGTRG